MARSSGLRKWGIGCVRSTYQSNQRQLRYVLNHEDGCAQASLVRIRPVTVRLRKDGSATDEKPYDPENVMRPKEQRARFLTEVDCNHLRDVMWLGSVPWKFRSIGYLTGSRRHERCHSQGARQVRTVEIRPILRPRLPKVRLGAPSRVGSRSGVMSRG